MADIPTTLALLGLLVLASRDRSKPPVPPSSRIPAIQTVRAACVRYGVPAYVGLAFADLESKLSPSAEGDLDWPKRKQGALYQQHVLGNPKLAHNPARDDPSAWHSYGLFQLLAPYWVEPFEHPRQLLDPSVNADRGVRFIGQLLAKHHGNVEAARLEYVGCGPDGSRCSAELVAQVRTSLARSLQKWRALEGVA